MNKGNKGNKPLLKMSTPDKGKGYLINPLFDPECGTCSSGPKHVDTAEKQQSRLKGWPGSGLRRPREGQGDRTRLWCLPQGVSSQLFPPLPGLSPPHRPLVGGTGGVSWEAGSREGVG